jgi:hypothetical protein
MPANVYSSLSNTIVYTDKLEISTTTANATLQVYAVALGTASPAGNIYSAPINIPAQTVYQTYVGAGNKVTVVSAGTFTALELGTASSATSGVIGYGSV